MSAESLSIVSVDPRCADACALIAAFSKELSLRYDLADDGSGNFSASAQPPRSAFLVGNLGGKPVACGAFRPLEEHVAEIKRMFVLPEHRGRGFSRRILRSLEELACGMNYTIARLETGDRQPEAIALYERSGYKRIPNFGIYVGSQRSVCFEKPLV